MEKFPKIPTLFPFNQGLKKFDSTEGFQDPNVELLKDNMWAWTEKVDGTNVRIYWDGYDLKVRGRTDKSQFSKDQADYLTQMVATEALENMIEQMFGEKEVYIYGELHGNNIQKVGKLYSDHYKFKVFGIKIGGVWLEKINMNEVAMELALDVVPYVLLGTVHQAIEYVQKNPKSTFSEAPLEGLVGIPVGGFLDRQGKRIAVKIKIRDLNKTVGVGLNG